MGNDNRRYESIKLTDIMIDPKLQLRGLNAEWVRFLEEQRELGERLPPPVVTYVGTTSVLVDGLHRVEVYKRAFNGSKDAEIQCEVIDCADTREMVRAALDRNRQHGRPLTEQERNSIYYRLTRELNWTRKEAREAIGITTEHAQRYESKVITMPVTERAKPAEKTINMERAINHEKTMDPERASTSEETITTERAMDAEKTIAQERASKPEKTNCIERATPLQTNGAQETTVRLIQFHVSQLKNYIPTIWEGSRAALAMLEEAIIEDMVSDHDSNTDENQINEREAK